MTSPADQQFLSALDDSAQPDQQSGLVTAVSPRQRLEIAMRLASQSDNPNTIPDGASYSYSNQRIGLPNPFGRGIRAFEPNTLLFEGYGQAKAESDQSKAEADALAADKGATLTGGAGKPVLDATGQVSKMIQSAMTLASNRVPYVWGGVSANGVDCSGLIYYAAKAAGIPWQRYRAVDYGHMGQAVSEQDARPGDIVYYDNPGTNTDHVGIYIGNGQMIEAPQSGDVVKVAGIGTPTSIRRIFSDAAFGTIVTPTGTTTTSYLGRPYQISVPPLTGQLGSTITRQPTTSGSFRSRAE